MYCGFGRVESGWRAILGLGRVRHSRNTLGTGADVGCGESVMRSSCRGSTVGTIRYEDLGVCCSYCQGQHAPSRIYDEGDEPGCVTIVHADGVGFARAWCGRRPAGCGRQKAEPARAMKRRILRAIVSGTWA